MVGTKDNPSLNDLSTWQAALTGQLEELRREVRSKQMALAQVEERLALVTKLIEVETRTQGGALSSNTDTTAPTRASSTDVGGRGSSLDLEAAVEEILRAAGAPLHISAIRDALIARGVPIPGRGDEANIIVRLRRIDDRFTRTARGTYGLVEWGIPAFARKTRRRRPSAAR